MYKSYHTEEEREEDCCKLTHIITLEDGTTKECDWSPYERMTDADIKKWVSLRFPKRVGVGPLRTEDIDQMLKNEFNDFSTSELVSYWNVLNAPCLGRDANHVHLPFLSAELTKRSIPHESGKRTKEVES